jgi:hypothetical protein
MTLDINEIIRRGEQNSRTFIGNVHSLEINLEGILSSYENQANQNSKLKEERIKELEVELGIQKGVITASKKRKIQKLEEIEHRRFENNKNFDRKKNNTSDTTNESDTTNNDPEVENKTDEVSDAAKSEKKVDEGQLSYVEDEERDNSEKDKTNEIKERRTNKFVYYSVFLTLIGLGIYLWIFYSSALYSTYIRDVDTEITNKTLVNSAGPGFGKAPSSKKVSVPLISFNAFTQIIHQENFLDILMGILYLITSASPLFAAALLIFISKKKGLKNIWVIYGLTFIFDVLIAIHITVSIHNAKINKGVISKNTSVYADLSNDVAFLLVIFTGFVGYLMFGFIYDYFIYIHDIHGQIRDEKRRAENKIQLLRDSIREIDEQIIQEERKENVIQRNIDRLKYTVSVDEKLVIQEVNFYIVGWVRYLYSDEHKNLFPDGDIAKTTQDCNELRERFSGKIKTEYGHSTNSNHNNKRGDI